MSNVFQTCLKGFKLKKLVVEPKTAQPVESYEELVDPLTQSVDLQLNWSRNTKNILSFRMVVQSIKGEHELVDPHLNWLRFGQGAIEVQRLFVKH